MFAKLLSLLLHAKSGALSAVFLLGATGALVSVSAANGVTTITITEASPSPTTAVTTNTTQTATRTPKPSESPKLSSSSSSTTACSDEAKALELQVQRVDSAFSGFHTDLMKLRGQRASNVLETSDLTLKQVRQAAVKALHATLTCKTDDEDKDEAKDTDTDAKDADDDTSAAPATTVTTVPSTVDQSNDEDNDNDHGKKPTSPITFTGTDPKGIADQAVAAMQVAFDAAKNAPVLTAKPAHSPETNSTDKKHGEAHD